MSRQNKPVANPSVVLREEFDDWAVLFNPDTADAAGINPVGVMIWKLMDGKNSIEDIITAVRNRFSNVPDEVTEDINKFVNDLAGRGFVGYEIESSA